LVGPLSVPRSLGNADAAGGSFKAGRDLLSFDALISEVKRTISEEMRAEFLLFGPQAGPLPPPSDVAMEAGYLREFINNGEVFTVLVPEDFFLPLHRLMFRAASDHDGKPTRQEFLEDLGKLCEVTEGIENAVDDIMDPERVLPLKASEMAERILEKSRARKLIEWMQRLDQDLRLGRTTTSQIKEKMVAWAKKT